MKTKSRNPFGLSDKVFETLARGSEWSEAKHRKFFADLQKKMRSPGYVPPARDNRELSLPGILSNVANKFLRRGFNKVERDWKRIAKLRRAGKLPEQSIPKYKSGLGIGELLVMYAKRNNCKDTDNTQKLLKSVFSTAKRRRLKLYT